MSKYFCFHCQQDVEPRRFAVWKFCPLCRHRITDDGTGFYRVCDNCGADMPSTARSCLRCRYNFTSGQIDTPSEIKNSLADLLLGSIAIFFCLLIFVALLYLSFYVLYIALIFGAAYFLYNLIFRHFFRN